MIWFHFNRSLIQQNTSTTKSSLLPLPFTDSFYFISPHQLVIISTTQMPSHLSSFLLIVLDSSTRPFSLISIFFKSIKRETLPFSTPASFKSLIFAPKVNLPRLGNNSARYCYRNNLGRKIASKRRE